MGEIIKVFSYAKEFKNKTYLATLLATLSSIIGILPFVVSIQMRKKKNLQRN